MGRLSILKQAFNTQTFLPSAQVFLFSTKIDQNRVREAMKKLKTVQLNNNTKPLMSEVNEDDKKVKLERLRE